MIKEDKPATGMQQGVPDVFAANVALLMRMYRDPAHATNESPVTSRRLAAPALTRIVRKPRYETVETLELLAEVFRRNVPGLEAWMLLYPNLDPKHLPVCVADHERDLLRRIRTFTAKQPAHIGKVSSDRLQGG